MARLSVLHFPDKRLHLKAHEVEVIDEGIQQLIKDMTETMYYYDGIGLAAIQVNVQKRIIIMDLSGNDEPKNLMVFINPEILSRIGKVISEEGCLSIPGIYVKVLRDEVIQFKYLDIQGQEHKVECKGLMAMCVQHEIDHLDGKVSVEYLSPLKQNLIKKKMKKLFKPV